jgi:hypothetical protein
MNSFLKYSDVAPLRNSIGKTFASTAGACTMSLHYGLATAKKGNSSITDYFHRIKQIFDTLAAAKQPLNDYISPHTCSPV